MKKINLIFSALTTVALPLVSISCNVQKQSKTKSLNLIDTKTFYDVIKESSQNKYPSVYITRNAAQVYNSVFNLMLSQLMLSEDKNDYNDQILLIDQAVQNNEIKENQRFNFKSLIKKYGSVLDKGVEKGRVLILNNTKTIEQSKDIPYNIFPREIHEYETYLKMYLEKGVNKFDFYIPDISFIGMKPEVRNWILKRANSITLLSDGNAQQYKFIRDNYLKWLKNQKVTYSKKELEQYWNNFQNNPELTSPEIDYHFFYKLEDKLKIFNFDGRYSLAFNAELEYIKRPWAKININNYPLDYTKIPEKLNISVDDYLNEYEKLNNLYGKKFEDLIVYGNDNLDKAKNNLIFMRSSLFRHYEPGKEFEGDLRLDHNPEALKEINQYFATLLKKYPSNQYNYIFKLHPYYKDEQALGYINKMLGSQKINPVIIDPGISWENLIAMEFKNLRNNTSVIFDRNDFKNNKSKTIITGLQATTTVLNSTYSFLTEAFGIRLKEAYSFVDPKNFPLSNKFNIVIRDVKHETDEKTFNANVEELKKANLWNMISESFPWYEEFISMNEFISKK